MAKKFGAKGEGDGPADPAERARQMRFLAARGFSAEVVRRVMRGGFDDES
ncbi:RecX family transcriptional regulator [Ottowia caeni]